jgi:hypothetical protein
VRLVIARESGVRPRLLLSMLATGFLISCGTGVQSGADERAVRFAARPHHGGGLSWDRRKAVTRDREIMAIYEEWLSNPERRPPATHTPTVVWWLAESGDLKYAATFVQSSQTSGDESLFLAAVYGLARTATNPLSRERLETLARANLSYPGQNHVAMILMYVGDEPSRAVLRLIDAADLTPAIHQAVTEVLDSPVRERGHWPCPDPLIFAKGADGVFSCRDP